MRVEVLGADSKPHAPGSKNSKRDDQKELREQVELQVLDTPAAECGEAARLEP